MSRKITTAEASQIRSLMQEQGWDVVQRLLEDEVASINAEPAQGSDAFSTLRALHRREGRVDGLKSFFEKLERGATE